MRREGGKPGDVRFPREQLRRTGIALLLRGEDGHKIVERAVKDALRKGKAGGSPRQRVGAAHLDGAVEGNGCAVCGDRVDGRRTADDRRRIEGAAVDEEGGAGDVGLDLRRLRGKPVFVELGILIVEEQPAVLGELHFGKRAPVLVSGIGALFPIEKIEGIPVGDGDISFGHRGVGGVFEREIFFIASGKEEGGRRGGGCLDGGRRAEQERAAQRERERRSQ